MAAVSSVPSPFAKRRLLAVVVLAFMLIATLVAGARAEGGTVAAWGPNALGQLNGTATPSVVNPTTVAGVENVVQIAAGGAHTLALRADGTVVAWGRNSNGQLGNNTTNLTEPTAPFVVKGLSNVIAVAAGKEFSLALRADGTVLAWGDNVLGQLGIETQRELTPAPVPGLTGVVAIAASGSHSVALRADGTVFGWGADESGQSSALGQGGEPVLAPTQAPGVSGAVGIATGESATFARLRDGSVVGWGTNTSGELGTGDVTSSTCNCLSPTVISGLTGATDISAGEFHGLAILPGGAADSWGLNTFGQLGTGKVQMGCECEPAPATVPLSPRTVRGVSAGSGHSLALLDDGTVSAWGENSNHQVNPGNEKNVGLPSAVSVGGATEVATGFGLSVATAGSFALVGPSQSLKVQVAGAGTGNVAATRKLRCPGLCAERFPQGQTEVLLPQATAGGFAGFSGGGCAGTGPCEVKLDSDKVVTATFGAPTGTAITGSRIVPKRRTASFSFAAPGAITGFQCELVRPRARARGRKLAPPSFFGCASGKTFSRLTPGAYTFEVRALDSLGADAHPAVKRFRISPRRRPRHHRHRRRHGSHR